MFRSRIAVIAALGIAIATGLGYVYLSSILQDSLRQRLADEVEHAERQFLRSARLEAHELSAAVATLAREDEFAQIFTKPTEEARRNAAYAAVEARRTRLTSKDGRSPALLAVVDKAGQVVARDLNIRSLQGEKLAERYPSITKALGGAANKDVWNFEGAMYRVGSAPIRSASGEIVGALVLGYAQSVADAKAEKERLGTEVAYFLEGKISASSFSREEGQSSESAEEKALASQLFEGPKLADAALDGHRATATFRFVLNGVEWVAAAAPLTGNATQSRSGFVVLSSVTAARAPFERASWVVLALGGVAMVMVLVTARLSSRRLLGGIDALESSVNDALTGGRDVSFQSPAPELEGLTHNLNLLLARLLGRPDPGAGAEGEGSWRRDALFVDEAMTAGEAPPAAEEPAAVYYGRIWREYVAARTQTGEGVAGLEEAQFVAKLKESEVALAKKYGVRQVRFRVRIKAGKASLSPILIKDQAAPTG